MPTEACQFYYECANCKTLLKLCADGQRASVR